MTTSRVSRRQNSLTPTIHQSTPRRASSSHRLVVARTSTNGFDAFARPRRTTGHLDPFQCTSNVFTRAKVPRPNTKRSNPKYTRESSNDERISSTPPMPRATYRNPTTRSPLMTTEGGVHVGSSDCLVDVKCRQQTLLVVDINARCVGARELSSSPSPSTPTPPKRRRGGAC